MEKDPHPKKNKKSAKLLRAEICNQLCFSCTIYLPPSVKAETNVSLAAVK